MALLGRLHRGTKPTSARPRERKALRIGISGAPGVGKSTFIEAFGLWLIKRSQRVAVLPVDPSSVGSGGAILGDKTRMTRLSREASAYIRPSPSGGTAGGVAQRTHEVVALCEAAGFDIILIETVGVGQSETTAAQLSDIFVLLLSPEGGDELQGIKRGILEMADLVIINKADGALQSAALRTCADYAAALRVRGGQAWHPAGYPLAMTMSAQETQGIGAVWKAIHTLAEWRSAEGMIQKRRMQQAHYWFVDSIRQSMLEQLESSRAQNHIQEFSHKVARGQMAPSVAAQQVLRALGFLPP